MTAFYGTLIAGGAALLRRRVGLQRPAEVLATLSAAVALICGVIAAASYSQSLLAGLLGTVLAGCCALLAARTLLGLLEERRAAAGYFAAAAMLIAVAGGAGAGGQQLGAGLSVLAAAGCACVGFSGVAAHVSVFRLALAAAVPAAALALAVPELVALDVAAVSLAPLTWLGWGLRRRGQAWGGVAAAVVIVLALAVSATTIGTLAAAALVGAIGCWRTSSRLRVETSDQLGEPSLVAAVAAGIAWITVSLTWTSALAGLLPQPTVEWVRDLLTSFGGRVSASWYALATWPCVAGALWVSDWSYRSGDPRRHVAELTALGVLIVAVVMSLATLTWQPLPTGIILLPLAALWFAWALRRASQPRSAIAHVTVLGAVFSLAYGYTPHHASVGAAATGLLQMALGSVGAHAIGAAAVPLFVVALLVGGQSSALWPTAIAAAYGLLVLMQPGRSKIDWLRPLGPPALLLALGTSCFYAPHLSYSPVHDDYLAPVLSAGVLVGALWSAVRHGPRFLATETRIAAGILFMVALGFALEHPPNTWPTRANGAACLVLLGSVLLVAIGASRRVVALSWLAAMLVVPLPVTTLVDAHLGWPGALAAAGAAVVLLRLSHRPEMHGLGLFGLAELLFAALWGTFTVCDLHAAMGDNRRTLTALAITSAVAAVTAAYYGARASGATPQTVRRFSLASLDLALLLALAGTVLVQRPTFADVMLTLASLATTGACAWALAQRLSAGWLLYFAEAAVLGLYGYVRWRTGFLDAVADYDGVVLSSGALGFIALSRALQRRHVQQGVTETRRFAAIVPLLVPLIIEWDGSLGESFGMLLASLVYGYLARATRAQGYAWLAALLLNLMLFPIWNRYEINNAIAFLLPIGVTLGLLTRIYRDQLGRAAPVLRTAAALLVLGGSSIESFRFESLLPALLLALLSVGAVVLGMVWRVRAYLSLGFAFLLLDIVVNLTRWGMQDRLIAGTIGVAAGIALFAFGVAVVRQREQLIQRYRIVRTWDW